MVPVIPDDETRDLWLTLETPRVGVLKLTAHVPVGIGRGPLDPRR
ncbi:MAG: hypothetical protein ACE5ID_06455 [Acidobacteriota bacterium]